MSVQSEETRPRLQLKEKRRRRLEALAKAERQVPVGFAIIGVQKSATTSLYRMLSNHPQIADGPEKEMRFFIEEKRNWKHPDYSTYARPARGDKEKTAGDATPEYLFWPNALKRMRRYSGDMRLIASFRDPVERAFSQWSMERSRDPEFPNLPYAIREWATPRIPKRIPKGLTPYELRRRSLFTRGLYGQQVRRALRVFPREQYLFLDFSGILSDPVSTLDRVTEHLQLRPFQKHPSLVHAAATRQDHADVAPTPDEVARVVELYRDDLPEFARLTGIDVSSWPTTRVLSGELPVAELTDRFARKLGLRPASGGTT